MYPEVQKAVRSVLLDGGYADLYILRFIKPLDEKYFVELAKNYTGFVFVEDGIISGGISEYLNEILLENELKNTKILAFEEKYFPQGTRTEVLEMAGLSTEHIAKEIKLCLK